MTDIKRRRLLKATGATVAVMPVAALFGVSVRAETPMVDPTAAQAQALQYVIESATDGQLCSGCALYQGSVEDPAAACGIFPGQLVAGPGWCSAWVPKG